MAKKIYISPSDQTNNAYAGTNTNEAVQCRKIGKALEKSLDRCGFDSKCNATSGMYDRIAESNKGKYDLHLCIHTNAANKKVTGTRIFVYKKSGEAYEAAKEIFKVLAPLAPGTSENISVNQTWAEILKTDAPCVYIEIDFHDVSSVAKWIVSHTDDIAEAIAVGLCNHYGVKYKAPESAATKVPFKVRVKISDLNIRESHTASSKSKGFIKPGVYTIVETYGSWGKLKSGVGWIHLGYVEKL